MKQFLPLALLLLAATPTPAVAQQQDDVKGDPSQGTGPQPSTPAEAKAVPLCADRPTKATAACTVATGHIQIESDALDWTRDTSGGTRTDTILYTSPTIKLGLGGHTDIELNVTPHESVRTRDASGVQRLSGFGDLYLRVKQRLTADDAKTQVAIIPYVKAPTARDGIGNRMWEGGAALAVNVPLPAKFTLALSPGVDWLGDEDGRGHHASTTMLANLSHPLTKKISFYAELWTQQNFDPARTERQYSADTALTWQLSKNLQLDAGANFGLNRETPATQAYWGIAMRF